jgi:Ca2+-binding EF-hand superfamily protein
MSLSVETKNRSLVGRRDDIHVRFGIMTESKVKNMFQAIDKEKHGRISVNDLAVAATTYQLGMCGTAEEYAEFLHEVSILY